MISLRKKIENAVRMGANCGSLDLTSDDTKTSIDLDDADIQALHDGLCDTEKLAWSCDDNKKLRHLNAEICAKSSQFEAMLRVANGSVADLQKEADALRSELANARANYEYSSTDRDKERRRADQAEAKVREQESMEDDLQIAERLSNGLNGELQATREKLIHAEILAKRWFDRFQVVDAKLASYTDDRSALATAVEGYEFQVEKLTEERDFAKKQLAEVDADRESWRLLAGERMDERDALRAQVAEMTSGEPVAWRVDGPGGIRFFSWESSARELAAQQGRTIAPLFAAAQPFPQAAELGAKYEAEKLAHGNTHKALANVIADRTAIQARVNTLLSGEYLAANALAAAEKRAATAEGNVVHYRTKAEAAEARVKVLEGDAVPFRWALVTPGNTVHSYYLGKAEAEVASMGTVDIVTPLYRHPPKTGEPVAWDVVGDDGMAIACDDEIHADKILDEHGGRKRPLYEAPPPAAVDVSHIRTLIEHGKQGCYDLSSFVIVLGNMLDKLPTVDVQTIRETCVTGKTAVEKWGKGAVDFVQFLDVILAAIGEKGG